MLRYELKEKKSGLSDRDDLVLLKFDKKSFRKLRWEKEDEFEYEGQMYDVLESEEKGDSVFYRCFRDNKETKLIKRFENLAYQAFQRDTPPFNNQYRGIDFQKPVYLFESTSQSFAKSCNFQITAIDYQHNYESVRYKPPTPPPRQG